MYSVEVDRSISALIYCLQRLQGGIPDFDYEWRIEINAGGIDYGIYINVDIDKKEVEISNQPRGRGEDSLDDILENFEEDDDWEDDEE